MARLFCFPYAGGGAAIFRDWAATLPLGVELNAIRLPGRESRLREPPARVLTELASQIADVLGPLCDVPYAFFGHSMGATVSFELARELCRRGVRPLEHLFVSGSEGPQVPDREPPMQELSDDEFLEEVQKRYGKLAAVLVDDPKIRALFLPCLRADVSMMETYEYEEAPLLECPITAFTGLSDASVLPTEVAAWRRETTGEFRGIALPGGHFFLDEGKGRICEVLAHYLGAIIDGR